MDNFAWFVIGLLVGTYAYHMISGWNAKRRGSEAKHEERAFRNADGLLQIAESFSRPKKEPKTTTNVRKLQSHRAALMEFCEQRGLKTEAQELIEHIDTEMETK